MELGIKILLSGLHVAKIPETAFYFHTCCIGQLGALVLLVEDFLV